MKSNLREEIINKATKRRNIYYAIAFLLIIIMFFGIFGLYNETQTTLEIFLTCFGGVGYMFFALLLSREQDIIDHEKKEIIKIKKLNNPTPTIFAFI